MAQPMKRAERKAAAKVGTWSKPSAYAGGSKCLEDAELFKRVLARSPQKQMSLFERGLSLVRGLTKNISVFLPVRKNGIAQKSSSWPTLKIERIPKRITRFLGIPTTARTVGRRRDVIRWRKGFGAARRGRQPLLAEGYSVLRLTTVMVDI